ncbi:sesquipedalian-1 isoform 1-T2 [Discoglossus pictus]
MKLNERNLVYYATCKSPVDKSGFLFKKGERNAAYHKRWFVLKGNMLFYFDHEESKEPVGVIILEGCRVELCESTEEYSFAIKFGYAKSRAYILAADSQNTMESWVKALSKANFEYIRLVVTELQKQLGELKKNTTTYYEMQGSTDTSASSDSGCQAMASVLQEKSVQPSSIQKDTTSATWDNIPRNLPNGYIYANGPKSKDEKGHPGEDLTALQFLMLEDHSQAGDEVASSSSEDSPISADTLSFLKLHRLYGEEIVELRTKWLENIQKQKLVSE